MTVHHYSVRRPALALTLPALLAFGPLAALLTFASGLPNQAAIADLLNTGR